MAGLVLVVWLAGATAASGLFSVPRSFDFFAVDRQNRRDFDKLVRPDRKLSGLISFEVQPAGEYDALSIDELPSVFATNGYSTAWRATEAEFFGHSDFLELRISAMEFDYIYAHSLDGLWPAAVRLYRQGDPYFGTPPSESRQASIESLEVAYQILVDLVPGDTSDPLDNPRPLKMRPKPSLNIANASVLGSDRNPNILGRLVVDCEQDTRDIANDRVETNSFSLARRKNCLGGAIPWGEDERCHNVYNKCMVNGYQPADCGSEVGQDGRPTCQQTQGFGVTADFLSGANFSFENGSCCALGACFLDIGFAQCEKLCSETVCSFAELKLSDLSEASSVVDLLNQTYVSLTDGSVPRIQAIKIQTKTKMGRNQLNIDEAILQLRHSSSASEALAGAIVRDFESRLLTRPDAVELTLVIAAQIAGVMAIDAGGFYSVMLGYFLRNIEDTDRFHAKNAIRISLLVGIVSSAIACIPGWITAGIIIYLEVANSNLKDTFRASGWHGTDLYSESSGESIFLISRIDGLAVGGTSYGIRPVYISLPLLLGLLEYVAEALIVRKRHWKERRSGIFAEALSIDPPDTVRGKNNSTKQHFLVKYLFRSCG